MENKPQEADQSQFIDNAIRAVREKKPLPEIDFTLHTMEDGNQVSTQERVCKGMLNAWLSKPSPATRIASAILLGGTVS
jgi:serine/threonine-protein phosphatase 2B catalytic subunit